MAPPTAADTAADPAHTAALSPTSPSGAAIKQQFVDLRVPAIAHPHQLLTLTCYVPPSKIGSVIGKRGQSVLTLQKEATKRSGGASGSVRVSIVGSGMNTGGGAAGGGPPVPIPHHAQLAHSDPNSAWAPVVIRADPVGAFAAARLLTKDIGGLDCMDDVVVDVPIHRGRHASIIGRKGLTIASLSAEYDVRIMVPQKRGGQQQQVLSAKQGGGGGGDEMLFPSTEESDTKTSGKAKGAKSSKGKGGKASNDDEDKNNDDGDEENNANNNEASEGASGAGGAYHSHRPANVNIVQLEGQLDDVERCLVKVMAIAAGAGTSGGAGAGAGAGAGGGAVGKIKSADGKAEEGTSNTTDAAAAEGKKMTRAEKLREKKKEKKAKAKAEREAAAAAATAAATATAAAKAKSGNNDAEAVTEDGEQTDDIPMDIEIKATKDNAEAAVDDTAGAAKEAKYSFAVVNATDETAHLMPSLRKLQALAKSTGAKIRRRKVDVSPSGGGGGGGDGKKEEEANEPTDNGDGEDAEKAHEGEEAERAVEEDDGGDDEDEKEDEPEEEEGGEDDAEAHDDASPGKQEITITGKTDTVKAAIAALEDIFGEGGCTYTLDALKTRKKKNGKRGGHQFRGRKKKKGGPGAKE